MTHAPGDDRRGALPEGPGRAGGLGDGGLPPPPRQLHLAGRDPGGVAADRRPPHHPGLLQQPAPGGAHRGPPQRAPPAGEGGGGGGAPGGAAPKGEEVGADTGMFATGVDRSVLEAAGLEPIRAHHGSMSKVSRLEMEGALKAGRLPALVATSSLELGIDVGEVDLVVHLQSPKSVSSGLQRVGRSGHLVGQTSVGRIFPTHAEDVMEAAAVARGMRRGEIEETHTPENPLDILAQHVVSLVGTEDWAYDDLYRLVRGAYPFRNLSPDAFRGVVEMLAGRYPERVSRYLQARLSWDRVHDRLAALPGTRLLASRQRGHHPGPGGLQHGPPGPADEGGGAGRGVRLRVPPGGHLPARLPGVAGGGDHRRPGGGGAGPGRDPAHALLAGRRPLAPLRPGEAHRGLPAPGGGAAGPPGPGGPGPPAPADRGGAGGPPPQRPARPGRPLLRVPLPGSAGWTATPSCRW